MSQIHRFVIYLFDELPDECTAFLNLKRLCEEHLADQYDLQVISLRKDPTVADEKDIFATPTVDREKPLPFVRIVGDLSDSETVIQQFGLKGAFGERGK